MKQYHRKLPPINITPVAPEFNNRKLNEGQNIISNKAVTDNRIQRKADDQVKNAEDQLTRKSLKVPESGGSPLPEPLRKNLEEKMQADFSQVRIHHDNISDQICRNYSAIAFTKGSHIFFRLGNYPPNTSTRIRLLVHELTHVKHQQRSDKKQLSRKKMTGLLSKRSIYSKSIEFFSAYYLPKLKLPKETESLLITCFADYAKKNDKAENETGYAVEIIALGEKNERTVVARSHKMLGKTSLVKIKIAMAKQLLLKIWKPVRDRKKTIATIDITAQ